MRISQCSRNIGTLTVGVLGGIAGGIAEIGWIILYGTATGIPPDSVARGIAESVMPVLATSAWAVGLGILVHFSLAVALGIGLAVFVPLILRHSEVRHSEFAMTILILAVVWAVNFLVVLPRLNPAFVHLLPYSVTLLSKLLFGFAAATVFRVRRRMQTLI